MQSARRLNRVIQNKLEKRLVQEILTDKYQVGDMVEMSLEGGVLILEKSGVDEVKISIA